jgi:hypothetical protein
MSKYGFGPDLPGTATCTIQQMQVKATVFGTVGPGLSVGSTEAAAASAAASPAQNKWESYGAEVVPCAKVEYAAVMEGRDVTLVKVIRLS